MTTTRILLQGPTTLQGAPPRPWIPQNNATALSYINSVEPVFNFTALTTFPGNRDGFRLWGTDDLPQEANGATIISVDAETAGRRAGGGAGSNYNVAMRDNTPGGSILGTTHFIPFGAGPLGFHIRNDNFPTDPNGDVWRDPFINGPWEFGLFQRPAAATGVSVSYIDMEVLWGGASGAWITIGISLLLPLLLPILGGMNLYHINDAELAKVHRIIKNSTRIVGELSYPSIVLRQEREMLFKALARPTYGV